MKTVRAAALAAAAATTAAAGNVLNGLPDCWESCSSFVAGEDCSWYDASCICDLANNSNYLSATITCASKTCGSDWDASDVGRFLAPIEFTCSLDGGVDPLALAGVSSVVSEVTVEPTTATTTKPQRTTTAQEETTTTTSRRSRTSQAAETTLRATITQSSSTAVVDQPVSFGSTGVSSGEQSTSIIVETINIVPVPASSAQDAGTTTAGGVVQQTGTPTATPSFEPTSGTESSTSSAAASPTEPPGGGGTLFDDVPGDASSNSIAGLVIAAYVVTVALIHAL